MLYLLMSLPSDTGVYGDLFPLQTKDPMVRISLDNYNSIFAVTPSGMARFLTLLRPVDHEEQPSYAFTVRALCHLSLTSLLSSVSVTGACSFHVKDFV